jgi:hypothetical protein
MAGPYGDFDGANEGGVVPQGNTNLDSKIVKDVGRYNARQQGVFAMNPLMTPKYAKNQGIRDAEFKDTLARIYISLPTTGDPGVDKTIRDQYLASLPQDASTQALAQVLLNTQTGAGFIDFFLTSANESYQEIMQVDKVLSDDYVAFFYGQAPPTFQYSGMLLNSMQDDQRSGFAKAYNLLLRGTQLARRGALARLRYDSVVVSGTMIAHQQQLNSDNELAVPFSFSFLVKEYVHVNNTQFTRTSADDYVQLAADASIAALGTIGSASSPRVNTVALTSQTPVGVSAAGTDQPTTVVDDAINALEQLFGLANTGLQTKNPTSNVRGTVTPPAPTPPAAPSGTP